MSAKWAERRGLCWFYDYSTLCIGPVVDISYLPGGFKHVLFSSIWDVILPIDELMFFKRVNGKFTLW